MVGANNKNTLARHSILLPRNSRLHLELSYESFKRIVGHAQAFPEFYRIVQAFGWRQKEEDEGWAGYYSRLRPHPQSATQDAPRHHKHSSNSTTPVAPQKYEYEACYILRHVEKQESEDIGVQPSGNWTIRKTAFYSKFIQDPSQSCSHSIIIEPSDALHKHLRQVLDPRTTKATVEFPKHWTGFSHLCLGMISVGWRLYTNLIAWEMKKTVRRCSNI